MGAEVRGEVHRDVGVFVMLGSRGTCVGDYCAGSSD